MGDRAWETGLNQPPLQRLPGTATDFIITEIEKPVVPFILDFFDPFSFPPPSTYSGCNHQQIHIPRAKGVRGKPESRLQPPPGWEWREMGSKPRDLESACLLGWPHLVSRGSGSESLSVETFAISILLFSRLCRTRLGVFQPESFGLSWLSQINTCPQTIRTKGKGVGCLGSNLDWSDPCYVSLDHSCVCFLSAQWDSQDWTFPRLLVKDRMSQCLSSA